MAAAYWFVMQHVEHDNDRYRTDKLAARRADITADAGPASLGRELNMIQAGDKGYAVRVIDPAGQIVAESPRMRTLLPVDVFPGILSIQRATSLDRALSGPRWQDFCPRDFGGGCRRAELHCAIGAGEDAR